MRARRVVGVQAPEAHVEVTKEQVDVEINAKPCQLIPERLVLKFEARDVVANGEMQVDNCRNEHLPDEAVLEDIFIHHKTHAQLIKKKLDLARRSIEDMFLYIAKTSL